MKRGAISDGIQQNRTVDLSGSAPVGRWLHSRRGDRDALCGLLAQKTVAPNLILFFEAGVSGQY